MTFFDLGDEADSPGSVLMVVRQCVAAWLLAMGREWPDALMRETPRADKEVGSALILHVASSVIVMGKPTDGVRAEQFRSDQFPKNRFAIIITCGFGARQ